MIRSARGNQVVPYPSHGHRMGTNCNAKMRMTLALKTSVSMGGVYKIVTRPRKVHAVGIEADECSVLLAAQLCDRLGLRVELRVLGRRASSGRYRNLAS